MSYKKETLGLLSSFVPLCVHLISAGPPETPAPQSPSANVPQAWFHFCSNKMKEAIMNQAKLAKLQAQVRLGGKGTAHLKEERGLQNGYSG